MDTFLVPFSMPLMRSLPYLAGLPVIKAEVSQFFVLGTERVSYSPAPNQPEMDFISKFSSMGSTRLTV